MTTAFKKAVQALTSMSAAGIVAALGYPAIAITAGLIILTLAAACWILSSNDRTERLARIILARRGNSQCLQAATAKVPLPGPARHRKRKPSLRKPTGHQTAKRRGSDG